MGLSLVEIETGTVLHTVDEIGKAAGLGFEVGDQIPPEAEQTVIDHLQSLGRTNITLSVRRGDQENSIDVFRHILLYAFILKKCLMKLEKQTSEDGVGLTLNVAKDGPADKSGFKDGMSC